MAVRKKSTKAELAKRIKEISEMVLSGVSRPKILEYARKKWNIGRAMTDNYISKAYKIFATSQGTTTQERLENHLDLRRDLYERSHAIGDYRTCLEIIKDTGRLQGFYTDKIHLITSQEDEKLTEKARVLLEGSDYKVEEPGGVSEFGT